ncbi:MAG: phosphatidylserine/phosphatidylglycerophosphate/cardiolipin synthase family protein [Myxococcales bacterium]|nr:phosphatidylserine/phosphatidylglycerophosphate/cardiolipin synthase family protein [Myxococcales bacterium]
MSDDGDDERRTPPGIVARLRATMREMLEGEVELLDTLADRLDVTVQRWADATGLRRLVADEGPDRLCALGEPVELSARIGTLRRAVADEIAFVEVLDDDGERELARARPDRDGLAAAVTMPDAAGVHRVVARVVGRSGHAFEESVTELALHVVDDAPVLLVDAELALAPPPELAERLDHLLARGWVVAFFDLASEARRPLVRDAMSRLLASEHALLDHSGDVDELAAMGEAFLRTFAVIVLRRLRARGVGVGWVVVANDDALLGCEAEGIPASMALPPAVDAALDADGAAALDAAESAVRDFHAARRAAEAEGRGVERRLDLVTRATRREGNLFRFELDNRRAREAVFAAIEGAERQLLVQVYILEASRFTDHLAVRLVRAARRGVRVRLIVDALYSRDSVLGLSNPLVRGLADEEGIEVVSGDPILGVGDLDLMRLKNRDHRKLVVADDRVAFVSGRNAGDPYYTGFDEVAIFDHTPHVHVPWLDAHVEVRGPLLADVQRSFLGAWTRSGGAPFEVGEPEPVGTSAGRLVVHHGVDDANGLLAYEALFDGAKDHVYILNDFPVVASLASAARRAVRRGVRVVFLTGSALARRADGTFFDGPKYRELFEHFTKHRLEPLLEAGVEVYEVQTPPHPDVVARGGVVRPYVHAKLVSVDGKVASSGSANLDVTASYWEREANVVVEDPSVVEALEAELETWVRGGVRLDVESEAWRKEAVQRELVARFWPSLVYS